MDRNKPSEGLDRKNEMLVNTQRNIRKCQEAMMKINYRKWQQQKMPKS